MRFMMRLAAATICLAGATAAAQTPADELHMNVVQETATFKKSDIASAELVIEDGRAVIAITLSPDGAKRFADLTARHVGKPVQIVVGDRILTTPRVKEPITGGRLHISGNFTKEEAAAIVARLR